MPLFSLHPSYVRYENRWRKCMDFGRGAHYVKTAGVLYLPRLEGQTDSEYAAYLMRTKFLSATSRTVQGYLGCLFSKDLQVLDSDDELDGVLTDVTNQGQTFNGFAKECAEEVFLTGRRGVLIDIPDTPDQSNPRPYCKSYGALDILNWRTEPIDGEQVLTLIVLSEWIDVPRSTDFYDRKYIQQWRVLSLKNSNPNPATPPVYQYWQTVYQRSLDIVTAFPERNTDTNFTVTPIPQNSAVNAPGAAVPKQLFPASVDVNGKTVVTDSAGFVVVANVCPVRNGKPLTTIPFVFIGSRDTGSSVNPIPIEDLVEVNHAHYMKSAGYNHALFFCGLPTPYVFGPDVGVPTMELNKDTGNYEMKKVIRIGSGTCLTGSDPDTKVGFMELEGGGVNFLKLAMDDDKTEMAVLGSRMLEEQKKAAETAQALQMRTGGDSSTLATLASTLSDGLTRTLVWLDFWQGQDDSEASVEVNQDFFDSTFDAPTLVAITQSWQAGGMSQDTYLWNLQRGGFLPPGVTPEQEADKIEAEPPSPAMSKPPLGTPPVPPVDPNNPNPPPVPPVPPTPVPKPPVVPPKRAK